MRLSETPKSFFSILITDFKLFLVYPIKSIVNVTEKLRDGDR